MSTSTNLVALYTITRREIMRVVRIWTSPSTTLRSKTPDTKDEPTVVSAVPLTAPSTTRASTSQSRREPLTVPEITVAP